MAFSPASIPADAASPFFVVSGTLPLNSQSYVPRQADKDLLAALLAGEYCFVLNSRQMGKSSLSVRTMFRLQNAGVRTVFLDLTKFGGSNVTPEQWYTGLLSETGRGLGLRKEFLAYWKENAEYSLVQRYLGALHDVALASNESRIVLFIDEIDAVKSLPFSTDEFFAAIRECYNRRVQEPEYGRLTFALVGSATPSDLIQDTRTSPFNIGKRIELKDFTLTEAMPLAEGIARPNVNSLVERAFYWTNGHPFLTQALCAEIAADMQVQSVADVDNLVAGMFFEAKARERNVNLADVSNRILSSYLDPQHREEHRAAILDLYRQVWSRRRKVAEDETNRLVAVLKLSGITTTVQGALRVRNRIYERVFDRAWIEQSMPDAELRRQRQAYRAGMLRTSALAACVVLVMTLLAGFAVHQAQIAGHLTLLANKTTAELKASNAVANQFVYSARVEMIRHEWEYDNVANMRQLLEMTRNDPNRGVEWDYWDRLSRGERLEIREPETSLTNPQYSRNGRWIFAYSNTGNDSKTYVFDAHSGKKWCQTERVETGNYLGLTGTWREETSDGRYLLLREFDRLALLDLAEQRQIWKCVTSATQIWKRNPINNGAEQVADAHLSGNRRLTLLERDPKTGLFSVKLEDLRTRQVLPGGYTEPTPSNSASLSVDGRYLLRSANAQLQMVKVATGETLWQKTGRAPSTGVFSEDGERCVIDVPGDAVQGASANKAFAYASKWHVVESATSKILCDIASNSIPAGSIVSFIPHTAYLEVSSPVIPYNTVASSVQLLQSSSGNQVWSGEQPYFTPDGKSFWVAGNNILAIYDAATFKEIKTLRWDGNKADASRHLPVNRPYAYSPDSKLLAVARNDGSLAIWDAALPIEQPIWRTSSTLLPIDSRSSQGDNLSGLHLSADGKRLFQQQAFFNRSSGMAGNTNDIRCRDARTGYGIPLPQGDTQQAPPLLSLDAQELVCFEKIPNKPGRFIANALDITSMHLQSRFEIDERPDRPQDKTREAYWREGNTVRNSCINAGTQLLHLTQACEIERFDLHTGKRLPSFNTPGNPMDLPRYPMLLCTPDSKTLLVEGDESTGYGLLAAVDLATGTVRFRRRFPLDPPDEASKPRNPFASRDVSVSPDSRLGYLSYPPDNSRPDQSPPSLLFDLTSGKDLLAFPHPSAFVFFPDGKRIATGDKQGKIEIWDIAARRIETSFTDTNKSGISGLQVTADGQRLFSLNDREARVWSVANGALIQTLPGVTQMKVFSDGSVLLSGEMGIQAHSLLTDIDYWWMRAPHAVDATGAELTETPMLSSLQGDAFAQAGQWQQAHDAFAKAVRLRSPYPGDYSGLALTQLALGDRKGYRQTCEKMLQLFGVMQADWICGIGPDSLSDYSRILALGQDQIERFPDDPDWKIRLGILQFRAGRYAAATKTLTPLLTSAQDDPAAWLALAMAHWRLGDKAEAQRCLKLGEEAITARKTSSWWLREKDKLQLEEARSMIQPH